MNKIKKLQMLKCRFTRNSIQIKVVSYIFKTNISNKTRPKKRAKITKDILYNEDIHIKTDKLEAFCLYKILNFVYMNVTARNLKIIRRKNNHLSSYYLYCNA